MNLLNRKWYRSLFTSRTFVKADGEWIDLKKYTKGKITNVDGKWNSQAYCFCGHELIQSNSFVGERIVGGMTLWDYKCNYCGAKTHWCPDIIPGLLRVDNEGNLLDNNKKEL